MLKKAALPLIIIFAGLTAIAVLVTAKPKPVPQPPPPAPAKIQVAVVQGTATSEPLAVHAQGTVKPKREIELVAQVSGQIVTTHPAFAEGGFFNHQMLLAELDTRDYDVAVLNAKARLADAEKRLAEEEGLARQAKREWRDLGNQRANELFMRNPQLAAAQANLAFALADLAKADLNLERTKILAPFVGRIKSVHADLGQFVSAGSPIATIYDSTVLEIRVPLTESQAELIDLPLFPRSGNEHSPQVTIEARVAGMDRQWDGQLKRSDAFVDPESRLYFAVIEVEQAPHAEESNQVPLLPGLFVKVTIAGKKIPNVYQLPRAALYQQDRILTVDTANRVRDLEVRVLRKSQQHVWVQGEITETTLVAIEKQSLLRNDLEVEPMQTASAQHAPAIVSDAHKPQGNAL